MITDMHIDQSNLKTSNKIIHAKSLWTFSGKGIIKHLTIHQGTFIMTSNDTSWFHLSLTRSFFQHLI